MPTASTEMVRTDGVTLVETRVTATGRHRVRLAVRCDGPVWPPRDAGADVRWADGTVTVEVATARGVGFATPAPPASVDVELVAAEPVEDLPAGVAAWLERVETRVAAAERLAAVDDLRTATAAVAAVGGLAEVEALAAELARDRRLLRRLSFVPAELCERAEAIELPVAALSTLAQPRSSR